MIEEVHERANRVILRGKCAVPPHHSVIMYSFFLSFSSSNIIIWQSYIFPEWRERETRVEYVKIYMFIWLVNYTLLLLLALQICVQLWSYSPSLLPLCAFIFLLSFFIPPFIRALLHALLFGFVPWFLLCFVSFFPFSFWLALPPHTVTSSRWERERVERERGNIGSSAERRAQHHQFCWWAEQLFTMKKNII